jgi:hypothetical protein
METEKRLVFCAAGGSSRTEKVQTHVLLPALTTVAIRDDSFHVLRLDLYKLDQLGDRSSMIISNGCRHTIQGKRSYMLQIMFFLGVNGIIQTWNDNDDNNEDMAITNANDLQRAIRGRPRNDFSTYRNRNRLDYETLAQLQELAKTSKLSSRCKATQRQSTFWNRDFFSVSQFKF